MWLAVAAIPVAAEAGTPPAPMVLASPAFKDGGKLPLSMVNNITLPSGANGCSLTGAAGGDILPALVWAQVPAGTRSLSLVMFDATASFTHWGVYDMAGSTRSLAANAGAAGSGIAGRQLLDDAGVAGYFGPCPPSGLRPYAHRYVFTLYALDTRLALGSANFPAQGETIYNALITAGLGGHVLGTATLTGYYSTTPAAH